MALLARAIRLSRRPRVDVAYRWIFTTAGGCSPEISGVVALEEVELPTPQVQEGSTPVETAKDLVDVREVHITKDRMPDTYRSGLKFPENVGFSAGGEVLKPSLKLIKPMSYSSYGSFNWCRFPQKVIRPMAPRLITPGSLPPVHQLTFTDFGEFSEEKWEDAVEYLRNNPPFCDVPSTGMFSWKPIPEEHFRVLERSLVELVHENKVRGYDITPSLQLSNLRVSKTYGTFALKNLEDYELTSDSRPFLGYKAAAHILEVLLNSVLWIGVLYDVSNDVLNYIRQLDGDTIDDSLNLYSAVLLCREGRAGLSVKIEVLLRADFWKLDTINDKDLKKLNLTIYRNMPGQYVSDVPGHFPTDWLHPDFLEYRRHSSDLGTLMSIMNKTSKGQEPPTSLSDPPRSRWLETTGKWLVMLNRHGVMHPKGLRSDSIDQLHSWMPDYLPMAQQELKYHEHNGLWEYLDMSSFFPRAGRL